MEIIYARIRQRARQIVSRYPPPDFYKDHPSADALSRQYLETNPLTEKLQSFVAQHLEDDYGHGIKHAIKVAVDAGTLMILRISLPDILTMLSTGESSSSNVPVFSMISSGNMKIMQSKGRRMQDKS